MSNTIPAWLVRVFHLPTELGCFIKCYMRGDRLAAVRYPAMEHGLQPEDLDVSVYVDASTLCFARLLRACENGEELEVERTATDAARIAISARLPGFKHRDMAQAFLVEARAIIARYGTDGPLGDPSTAEGGSSVQ